MTAKALRPTTIIPEHLYVERMADRQLEQVVIDMGRPGYVLVARQMGKTNLLLNMKRRREAAGDIVLYQDLSIRFSSARALFRSIVDALIDLSEASEIVSRQIQTQRREETFEPNQEYDRHLRLLLRSLGDRRVIIVFDEIDSLVSASYSDAIFAQIRSMYFSRINHPEYERLTYALSGVAEPTDLIKDKNISPFNIGEKIYLDDFTRVEFEFFLDHAKLILDNDVKDAIFSWTGGNPRMTWDVASAVEDVLLAGSTPSPADVDDVVKRLYLTQFDRAPVDHIRSIVEGDPIIRNAVISLRWNKAESLDEKTRARLYLAGITKVSTDESPVIKNRIIDAAISDSWLAQVSAGQRTLLEAAADSFLAGSYDQVVRLVEEYRSAHGSATPVPLLHRYYLGYSRLHLGQHDAAADDLASVLADSEDGVLKTQVRFSLGRALAQAGRTKEAIPLLEYVASTDNPNQFPAKVTLASAYFLVAPKDYRDRIAELADEVIVGVESGAIGQDAGFEPASLLASAYYIGAQSEIAFSNAELAAELLTKSQAVAPKTMQPRILLRRGAIAFDFAESSRLLRETVDTIIKNNLTFSSTTDSLAFNEIALFAVLVRALTVSDENSFRELLSYARAELFHHVHDELDLILRLARTARAVPDAGGASALLWYAVDHFLATDTPTKKRLELIKYLPMVKTSNRGLEAQALYLNTLEERIASTGLDEGDAISLIVMSIERHNEGNYAGSLQLLGYIEESNVELQPIYQILLMGRKLTTTQILGDMLAAKDLAFRIAQMFSSGVIETIDVSWKDVLDGIQTIAQNVLSRRMPDPFRNIGRNVLVRVRDVETGRELEVKFKKIESELRSGKSILLRSW